MAQTGGWARFLGYGADPSQPLEAVSAGGLLATGEQIDRRRAAFPDLDFSPPARPPRDELLLPKKLRRRGGAPRRRPASRAEEQARLMAEKLPPSVQRSIRAARRQRRAPGED